MIFPLSPPMFDLLILSITEKKDSYGYQLSQKIKNVSGVKDSTLYPILKRLQEQGYLSVYDQRLHKEAIDQILKGEHEE